MVDEKINLVIILEILGRPAEHIKDVMNQLIEKLAEEKGVEIVGKKISEPKAVENSDLFTLFSEVELNVDSVRELLIIIFSYMPAHIDIITPENIRIKNDDLNLFSNELIRRLHQYDEIAKTITIERNMLKAQLERLGEKPAEFNIPKKEKKIKKKRKKKK